MPKKPLTREQKINLLWLEIKRNNNKIPASTYQAVKSCIRNGKPIIHIKEMSEIEKEYLEVFTKDRNNDFLLECISVQEKIKAIYNNIK